MSPRGPSSPDGPLRLSPAARAVVGAPDGLARAAAATVVDRERRWLLRQPRAVRRAFLDHVVIAGRGSRIAQERWLLLAPLTVRESYVRDVLDRRAT